MIISLTGFMGSGKSRVGRILADELSWEFIDLDRYIEHKMGRKIPDIFSEDGEDYFRAVEAEAVRDVITMRQITGENLVLALGGGTLSIKPIQWLILEQTSCVYLRTGLDCIIRRLGTNNPGRPLLRDKYSVEELLDERIPTYEMAPYTADTDKQSPDEVAAAIKSFFFD